MSIYIVSYDLHNPGKDYAGLYVVLENLYLGKRVLESVWMIQSKETTQELYDFLCKYIDKNDKISIGLLADWKC